MSAHSTAGCPAPQPPEDCYTQRLRHVRYNFKMSVLDGMFANVAVGLVTPFLGVYLLALGGSNTLLGLLVSLPALVNLFAYVEGARLAESRERKLGVVAWTVGISRLFYLLLLIPPFLGRLGPAAMVAMVTMQTFAGTLAGVAWTALMGDTFPQEERGRIFGLRNMYCSIMTLIATLAAGSLLDRVAYPWNFMAVMALAFAAGIVSLVYLRKMKEFPAPVQPKVRTSLAQRFAAPFSDKAFGRKFTIFTLSAFLIHMGINLAAPVFTIYHVKDLGLSNELIGMFAIVSGAMSTVAYPFLGGVVRKHGNRFVFFLSAFGFAVFPFFYALTRNIYVLTLLQAWIGFWNAGFLLTMFNMVLNYSAPERSANTVAVFNVAINVTGVIGPFIGTALVDAYGSQVPLMVSAALRFLGWLAFFKVVDVRKILRTLVPKRRLGAGRVLAMQRYRRRWPFSKIMVRAAGRGKRPARG